MGWNLILNMGDHGLTVAVYNRTAETTCAGAFSSDNSEAGVKGISISLPRVLGSKGIIATLHPALSKGESVALRLERWDSQKASGRDRKLIG